MITSADEFRALVESDDVEERRRAAWEPASEAVWLEVLARFPDLHFFVAHNRSIPDTVIARLVEDGEERVRIRLAEKHSLPLRFLEQLARDPSELVVSSVITHKKAPEELVRSIAEETSNPWLKSLAIQKLEKYK
jgi:hypothetical protein